MIAIMTIFNLICAMGCSYAAALDEFRSNRWYITVACALLNGAAVGYKLYEALY